jgi:hypothetical protein
LKKSPASFFKKKNNRHKERHDKGDGQKKQQPLDGIGYGNKKIPLAEKIGKIARPYDSGHSKPVPLGKGQEHRKYRRYQHYDYIQHKGRQQEKPRTVRPAGRRDLRFMFLHDLHFIPASKPIVFRIGNT